MPDLRHCAIIDHTVPFLYPIGEPRAAPPPPGGVQRGDARHPPQGGGAAARSVHPLRGPFRIWHLLLNKRAFIQRPFNTD